MLFFLACTYTQPSLHELISAVAQEYQLPSPEVFDSSTSVIFLSKTKQLYVQQRYEDVEMMLYTGLSISDASTVQNASLTLHQIALLNHELATSKVQVDPENAQIIFSCLLDINTMNQSILTKRMIQLITEEKQVHDKLEAALY